MRYSTLLRRSLFFYWRTNLGVVLAMGVATGVLVGALVLGDSVRHSLERLALSRLGKISLALGPHNRLFTEQLADRLAAEVEATVAPALILRGFASSGDESMRASDVQVIAADHRFWLLGGREDPLAGAGDGVVLNRSLAGRLRARVGDEILLRFAEPSELSGEVPLSVIRDGTATLRLRVVAIVSQEQFGNFALSANQTPPRNAFVSLRFLQQRAELVARVNTLLVGAGPGIETVTPALRKCWTIADTGAELRELDERETIELRSRRIFLDPPLEEAASASASRPLGVLTYFVNELRADGRSTPYSMITALGPLSDDGQGSQLVPPDMSEEDIVINRWVADDLGVSVGDKIELTYFIMGPLRRLTEQTSAFTVRRVIPIQGLAAERDLTPQFPGLSEVRNCRDWDPGIPIDLKRIRKKDEEYWSRYGAAPKGFIALSAGRKIWTNRFGALTAIRYPADEGPPERIASRIMERLDPASLGLLFSPVRESAIAATREGLDFAQLFLGLSFFLIVSGLLLGGLVLSLTGDQRRGEAGILLALGVAPHAVRRILLCEGALLASIGAIIGTAGGVGYTRAIIAGLTSVWGGAIANTTIYYHADVSSLVTGGCGALVMGLLMMWFVLRRQSGVGARELLGLGPGGVPVFQGGVVRRRTGLVIAILGLVIALAIVSLAYGRNDGSPTGAFFSAGSLLLIAGLAACYYVLNARVLQESARKMSLGVLARRNVARRAGRSLGVVGLLACGCFLIVAVGANRADPRKGILTRSSGTGGFALVGRSDLPVYENLNAVSVRQALGLGGRVLSDTTILPLRVLEGDDASCLNLNRAQRPLLIGVSPGEMLTRRAFSFVRTIDSSRDDSGWSLLREDLGGDTVPCVADQATVVWGLGKKLGDTLSYIDDTGDTFEVRIVAVLANSIFQGALLISQEDFSERFPSVKGYREFLIETPARRSDEVAAALQKSLSDFGFELEPAAERLARFMTVQNTYISIFQVLGGLGMLLGVAGVAIVVSRNVLERRGELGLMRAVGFAKGNLKLLTFLEHCGLLVVGVILGTGAAVVAVLPALKSAGRDVPFASLGGTLLIVFISGVIWVYVATGIALRRAMLAGLRNE